jgi:hypothetical protein
MLNDMMPGNIRKAENFIQFFLRVINFLKRVLREKDVKIISTADFLNGFSEEAHNDKLGLQKLDERF